MSPDDRAKVGAWVGEGHGQPMRTPEGTMVFVTPEDARRIRRDQADCMGCLSHCQFSSWRDTGDHTTHHTPDPRSFASKRR